MNDQTQPKSQDAILGGQVPPTGVVLGGLDGIKQRLASGVRDQQTAAATQALQYGEAGLDLLLQALQKESIQLPWAAYWALSQRTEAAVNDALSQQNPYRSFQRLFTFEGNYVQGSGSYRHIYAVSPDSQYLVTHSFDETLKVWSLRTGDLLGSFQGNKEGLSFGTEIVISLDGQKCFIGYSDGTIRIKSLETGQIIEILKGAAHATSIALSQDGQQLVIGCQKTGVQVWDLEAKQSRRFEKSSWYVQFVAFSPDGQLMISEARGPIKVWHRHTGELLHTLNWEEKSGGPFAAQISLDGETVVAVSSGGIVQQWNLKTGELLRSLRLHPTRSYSNASSAAFSPDGRTLLESPSSVAGGIELWNWQTGELLYSMEAPSSADSVVFSPNGRFAVGRGKDGKIRVWGFPLDSE